MSINLSAMNKLYGVQSSSFAGGEPVYRAAAPARAQAPEKTDVISISPQGSFQQEVSRVSKSVLGEIRDLDADNTARIGELRAQIENHTYQIPSGALAEAILQQGALL